LRKEGDEKADNKALGKFETYEYNDIARRLGSKPPRKNEVVHRVCFEVRKRQNTKNANAWSV
jgi:hypothetical protein